MYTIPTITQTIIGLPQDEKHVLFQIIFEHAALLDKIIPGLPLIGHATGQQVLTHPLAIEYTVWLNAKT
jgi:hypothetical protein